jgi:hypothetical protein
MQSFVLYIYIRIRVSMKSPAASFVFENDIKLLLDDNYF